MSKLKVFENEIFKVSAKQEGEQILFDAEEVAYCLGIISVTKKNQRIYKNVRWSRVNEFLPQVAEIKKGDLIPEPLVYKLAFKAQNNVAEKFQDWLAAEVIPQIRKTGSYQKPKSQLEILQLTVSELTSQDKRITNLEENMRIDSAQEFHLNKIGKKAVIRSLGGYNSPAYKEMSNKVFARFWRDFKQHFVIPRYGDLPKKKFDEGVRFIKAWQPDTSTRLEIESYNQQQTMKDVI